MTIQGPTCPHGLKRATRATSCGARGTRGHILSVNKDGKYVVIIYIYGRTQPSYKHEGLLQESEVSFGRRTHVHFSKQYIDAAVYARSDVLLSTFRV
eukprot:SAG31_NODE_8182_length_1501_cov_1.766762_1_plen_96_part_10